MGLYIKAVMLILSPTAALAMIPARTIMLERPPETLRPELIPICACESVGDKNATPSHFDKDGKVLIGRLNSSDIGICQINRRYHEKDALKMGLDLSKEADNIKFANQLYERQGSKPWNWSKKCWQ